MRSRSGCGTQGLNANYLLGDNQEVIVCADQTANWPQPTSGRRGRTVQPFPVNLLRRLRNQADAMLRSATSDPVVPFTNNTGEHTLRTPALLEERGT